MEWSKTIASGCRYGDLVGTCFDGADVIWEDSHSNYQGWARVLGVFPNGKFIFYEWTYGSCNVCDDWDKRSLSDSEILEEIRRELIYMSPRIASRYTRFNHDMHDSFEQWAYNHKDLL